MLLNSKQVAELLSVSEEAVKKWRLEGKIEFIKLGKLVRFRPEAVDAFVARGRQHPMCAKCGELIDQD